VALRDFPERTPYYGAERFRYDPERDEHRCPQGQPLRRYTARYGDPTIAYRADAASCDACPVKAACTPSQQGRRIHRSSHEVSLDRVRGSHATPAYQKAMPISPGQSGLL
jgi:hypothetical protein